MPRESAVDIMNDAIDQVIERYRSEMGCGPRRHEIYDIYKMAVEGRMFADDDAAETVTATHSDRMLRSEQTTTR